MLISEKVDICCVDFCEKLLIDFFAAYKYVLWGGPRFFSSLH